MNIEAIEDGEEDDVEASDNESDYDEYEVEYLTSIQPNEEWANFKNTLALDMFNAWRSTSS